MNEQYIKRLIRIVEESGIDELEVSRWGRSVRIVKRVLNGAELAAASVVSPTTAQVVAPSTVTPPPSVPAAVPASRVAAGQQVVRAPMVGTFYRAPSPDAPPYVETGDRVRKGQTLCILEAMKLMNEIESEWDGVVRAVLAENGEPIEYGQPLFELEVA